MKRTKCLVLFAALTAIAGQAQIRSAPPPQSVEPAAFTEYYGSPSAKILVEAYKRNGRNQALIVRTPKTEGAVGAFPSVSVSNWLAAFAANADAVVIGRPLKS